MACEKRRRKEEVERYKERDGINRERERREREKREQEIR